MESESRFFYHSFPRPRPGESDGETADRGWAILQTMQKLGLILAPEIVEWHTPVSLGTPSPIRMAHTRQSWYTLTHSNLAAAH